MYRLGRLGREEAESAITKPAAHFGIHVDPALAERIIDELYKEGVQPPQLQIVCDRLYSLMGEGHRFMGMKQYEQEESAQAILDNWIETVLSRLARRERVAARSILKLLITAHETRASLSLEEVAADIEEGVEVAARMIAHLVDLRMIREVEEVPGTFELVHEYVAHAMRGWISERELRVKDVQGLLGRQLNSWRKFGILMHLDELNLVHEYRDSISVSRDELALIIRSAAAESFQLDYWLGRLEELGDRQFPVLRDMTHDRDAAVRGVAVQALAELDDRRAIPLLIDALDDDASDVRDAAHDGLRDNERELMEALTDSSAGPRDGAARALGRIGSRRGARELLERLRDDDVVVRSAAAQALQSVPDARLTGSLLKLLDTPPASWAAAEVLATAGSDAAVLSALGDAPDAASSAQAHYVVARVHLSARRLQQAAAHLAQAEAACDDEEGARLIAAAQAELAKVQERQGSAVPTWDMFHKDHRRSGAAAETIALPLAEAWRYRADDFVASSPALVNELVYIGARDGHVHCLELATGAPRWRFATQDRVESSPAIGGNVLYVGSHDGHVYAIDARSGERIWAEDLEHPVRASCNLADGLVVVGCWDAGLYGLDAQSGRQRWRFSANAEIYSSAAVAGGTAFVGSWDGRLYAIDCEDGGKRWEYRTDSEIFSSPAIAELDDMVIFGSDDGGVYALAPAGPELVWRQQTEGAVRSSPAIADGVVYVGSLDGAVYALQLADGKVRWTFTTGEEVISSPAVAGDVVFVGSRDGTLYALSAEDGECLWRDSTDYGITSSPAVCGGHVVVGMDYYHVCAFRTAENA
jgi:outer membrane protein assembly factor BamB